MGHNGLPEIPDQQRSHVSVQSVDFSCSAEKETLLSQGGNTQRTKKQST